MQRFVGKSLSLALLLNLTACQVPNPQSHLRSSSQTPATKSQTFSTVFRLAKLEAIDEAIEGTIAAGRVPGVVVRIEHG
ncbi:MAG: hypothetical protein ACKVK0_13940, partial [Pirellulales bacterium]